MTAAPTQPPAVTVPAAEGRFEWHTYAGAPGARRYKLYVPASYDARRPAPLVVMLHGCTQDPDDLARGTRMNAAAERSGALVAYPEQVATANPLRCWRWFEAAQQRRDGEEVALVAGITREVMQRFAVDARRVYLAGISAGGAMALIVAASHPELYASAASHSGVAVGVAVTAEAAWAMMRTGAPDGMDLAARLLAVAGEPSRAVPLLVVHGLADNTVSARNARQIAEQWAMAFGPVPNGAPESAEVRGRRVELARWGRGGSTLVELAVVSELGHAWSGGSRAGTFADEAGPEATELMLAFFARHPRDE
ncbi:esterase, PHB depolymerase family [Gemmatirosa kalamazoonensis]|uniref:Esterase, PHB depolymerase family n=1 Tax=Gemmatirosa kalamazoonensis TaxID=861299 RepID=W0RJL5_9BACT|nr:PHB depolymerase family esterase [Gemmatirosa kalamazoonensis]AHG91264.1 esterase, PHB depolymerase family [Gemmatirosa kalamazoonensis]